mgnify:CR=1 FL=1
MQTQYSVGDIVLCKRRGVCVGNVQTKWPAQIIAVQKGSHRRGVYVLQWLRDWPTACGGDFRVYFNHADEYISRGRLGECPDDVFGHHRVLFEEAKDLYDDAEEGEEEEEEEDLLSPVGVLNDHEQKRIDHEQKQWERRRNQHFHAVSEQKRKKHQPLPEIARLEQLRTQVQTNARQELARLYPGLVYPGQKDRIAASEMILVIECQILHQHFQHDAELKKSIVALFSADPENARFPLSEHYRHIDAHRQQCVGESCKICRCVDVELGRPIKVKHIKEL